MEEQVNKEAKQGWKFAADAARITDDRAGSEDRKRTSGGVFVAIDSNVGAVVDKEEGTVTKHGRMFEEVCGFCRKFWHSEGWTPRQKALMEGVVKQTRQRWLVLRDANMNPEDFKKSWW